MEYNILTHVNKTLLIDYSSTTGNWTGHTTYAKEMAKNWNRDPIDKATRKMEKRILCDDNILSVKELCK